MDLFVRQKQGIRTGNTVLEKPLQKAAHGVVQTAKMKGIPVADIAGEIVSSQDGIDANIRYLGYRGIQPNSDKPLNIAYQAYHEMSKEYLNSAHEVINNNPEVLSPAEAVSPKMVAKGIESVMHDFDQYEWDCFVSTKQYGFGFMPPELIIANRMVYDEINSIYGKKKTADSIDGGDIAGGVGTAVGTAVGGGVGGAALGTITQKVYNSIFGGDYTPRTFNMDIGSCKTKDKVTYWEFAEFHGVKKYDGDCAWYTSYVRPHNAGFCRTCFGENGGKGGDPARYYQCNKAADELATLYGTDNIIQMIANKYHERDAGWPNFFMDGVVVAWAKADAAQKENLVNQWKTWGFTPIQPAPPQSSQGSTQDTSSGAGLAGKKTIADYGGGLTGFLRWLFND